MVMRVRLLLDYESGDGGRMRFRNELLTVSDERGREMIALGLAEPYGEQPHKIQHPDVLTDVDEHE